ncbi:MAG: transglutaminase family protein, partial [Saprospiraceae bacterium]
MTKYKVNHITKYTYPTSITESMNHVMLFPFEDNFQEVRKHELVISNHPVVETFTDYFGNKVGVFSISKSIVELLIQSRLEVSVLPSLPPADTTPAETQWTELQTIKHQFPFIDFLWQDKFETQSELKETLDALIDKTATPFANAQKMSEFVYTHFEYKKGITDVETKVNDIWTMKAGVCQDFAHILLAMLRINGIPARYVSGYICPKNNEMRGEGATHAWVEAYIPFDGWIGIDPTNNCLTSDRHIRLAIGRNFSDCTPVKGTYKGNSGHTLEVAVHIESEFTKNSSPSEPVFSYQIKQPEIKDNS